MGQHQMWFENFRKSKEYSIFRERPIAYFCAEFALSELESNYAGGLGVLAGDVIREAALQKLPMVAIGMFYDEGYLHHELQFEGTLLKRPTRRKPKDYGFSQVVDTNKQTLIISIPLEGRALKVHAWEKQLNTVRLFLLDTDVSENDQADRNINNRLYTTNKEARFKQQIILGIAGLRLLESLHIHPSIYHLNEGHSALLSFEVAHHEMKEYKSTFFDELLRAKQHIVFTNHTLLPAGNDTFNSDMVSVLLADYSSQLQVPVNELVALGQVTESRVFSMTLLALRMASHINAVSKLHAQKAKEIWADHPMMAITNGIHIQTWDKIGKFEVQGSFQKTQNTQSRLNRDQSRLNRDQQARGSDTPIIRQSETTGKLSFPSVLNGSMLWQRHQGNKKELLGLIQQKTGNRWDEHHLLIGWARRMVAYKRPLALFQDRERLLLLVKDVRRPLRIVIAGSAHESDIEGAEMLEVIRDIINSDLGQYIVYLPDYNINLAQTMIPGCDVWLNTPVVGFEACGTSGMKACLNGVLPCSTKDGWMAEVELYGIGWSLDSDSITDSLLSTIEHQIVPLYYYRDIDGIPNAWIENMKNSRELILSNYSATRMLREYIAHLYMPTLAALQSSHN